MPLTNEARSKGGRKSKGGRRPSNAAKEFWRKHHPTAQKKFLALLKCGDPRVERDVAQYIIERNEGKITDRLKVGPLHEDLEKEIRELKAALERELGLNERVRDTA